MTRTSCPERGGAMESSITLSQLADLIIVSFFGILAAGGIGFVFNLKFLAT